MTGTPAKGLASFVASDRPFFFGRDEDLDALAEMLLAKSARAALLIGEPGVGKTSLLHAGLGPLIEERGATVLFCEDVSDPVESFARTMEALVPTAARGHEKPADYLARVVGDSPDPNIMVFVIDDVGLALSRDPDGKLARQLADLFQRVASRSRGRVRFLLACAEARMHWLNALERKTGSLFPPTARYRLQRFNVVQTQHVLSHSGNRLAAELAENMGQAGLILPADLQMVLAVMQEQSIQDMSEVAKLGGVLELLPMWIRTRLKQTGNVRLATRLLSEMAIVADPSPMPIETIADRAGVGFDFATRAFATFNANGLCLYVAAPAQFLTADTNAMPWVVLAHETLVPRIRELAAPSRQRASRARLALAHAAENGSRVGLRDWFLIARQGVAATSVAEEDSLKATRLFAKITLGTAAALPILLIIVMYVALSGSYYLTLDKRHGAQRVVARAGSPGLSSFFWLPHSPSFGSVITDVGFTEEMASEAGWKLLSSESLTGDVDDSQGELSALVVHCLDSLDTPFQQLVRFALNPDDETPLTKLDSTGPEATVKILRALAALGRGGKEESLLVQQALSDESPRVQRAALQLVANVARRNPGAYEDVLATSLASRNNEHRRQAFDATSEMSPKHAAKLLGLALGKSPPAEARRDLLRALAARGDSSASSIAAAAVGLLSAESTDKASANNAWRMIDSAIERDAGQAAQEISHLVADTDLPKQIRVRAMALLDEHAPEEAFAQIAPQIEEAVTEGDPVLLSSALPLFARVDPEAAGKKLITYENPSPDARVAIAKAWGKLAHSKADFAIVSLEPLLADKSLKVRAAAAQAYGHLGRRSQTRLSEMVKKESSAVAAGAAWGLAASIETGGNPGAAVRGLGPLWKKDRALASEVMAKMARKHAGAVMRFLTAAAKDPDTNVRVAGAGGLCNALDGGGARAAARALQLSATDSARQVRQRVAACLAARPSASEISSRLGIQLATDSDPSIRLEAARALARAVDGDETPALGAALVGLVGDDNGRVRSAAAQGLAGFSGDAPASADVAIQTAWEKAEPSDKPDLLLAAQVIRAERVVRMGARDRSAPVRAAALRAAVAMKLDTAAVLGAGLTDSDPQVRKQALALVGDPKTRLPTGDAVAALELAIGDDDPGVAEAALVALASLEDIDAATERVRRALTTRSEQSRVRAARATRGLVERDAKAAAALLEPALLDGAHDVRVALAASLARAYEQLKTPAQLVALLKKSERSAMQRAVAAQALYGLAKRGGGGDIVDALAPLSRSGPPMAQFTARLLIGLIKLNADATFLAELVP